MTPTSDRTLDRADPIPHPTRSSRWGQGAAAEMQPEYVNGAQQTRQPARGSEDKLRIPTKLAPTSGSKTPSSLGISGKSFSHALPQFTHS